MPRYWMVLGSAALTDAAQRLLTQGAAPSFRCLNWPLNAAFARIGWRPPEAVGGSAAAGELGYARPHRAGVVVPLGASIRAVMSGRRLEG